MKKYLICLFILCLIPVFCFSQNQITVQNKNDLLMVGKQTFFLEDDGGKLEITDILKAENQAKFQQNQNDILIPLHPQNYYWLKLTVKKQINEPIWIEIGTALLWEIDYYTQKNGVFTLNTHTGALEAKKSKAFPSNLFLFSMTDTLKEEVVYFRVYTQNPAPIPIRVGSLHAISENKMILDTFMGAFIGLIIIMLVYNLFLMLATKDNIYSWYIGYLVMLLLFTPFINDYTFIVDFFPDNLRIYFFKYLLTWCSPLFLCIGLFTIQFLTLKKKHQKIYRYIQFLMILFCGIVPLLNITQLISPYDLVNIFQALLFLYYLSLLSISFYLWIRHKNQNAFYYSLAWSGFMVNTIIAILSLQGAVPFNYFTRNAMVIGAGWEILLFSLALANRINLMRREKESSQKALLAKTLENEKMLINQNEILEQKVSKRTRDLQQAVEEVQVTNEELQQTQEEIMAQRDSLEQKNITLEYFRNKISTSIESALLIQKAILPTNEKMQALFDAFFVVNKPKDVVSGDFYWVSEQNNKRFVIVADCTGHGVSGAFMTMIGNTLLDKIVKLQGIENPAEIINQLHLQINDVLQQSVNKDAHGMDIAICAIEKLTHEEFKIDFAGAKRNMYFTSNESSDIQKLLGTRKNIGGRSNNEKEFVNETIILSKNSLIYLATDGYADQNNLRRNRIQEKGFMSILGNCAQLPLIEQKEMLESELDNYKKDVEQRDDILVLGIKL